MQGVERQRLKVRATLTATPEDKERLLPGHWKLLNISYSSAAFKISCLFIFFKIYVHKKRKIYNRKDCLTCNTNSNKLMMGSYIDYGSNSSQSSQVQFPATFQAADGIPGDNANGMN